MRQPRSFEGYPISAKQSSLWPRNCWRVTPVSWCAGSGTATISEEGGAALLERLADRYIGQVETPFRKWLLAGAEEEVAITITPIRFMSWDYRNRMTVK